MPLRSLAVASVLMAAPVICAYDPASAQSSRDLSTIQVRIRQVSITVHLAGPATPGARPLVVYTTGDGGWPGDERLFDRMMPWGAPMAGLSSVDYIESIDTAHRMIEPEVLAKDFQTVIDSAVQALKLPKDQPVVLVGFSRGAGLSVGAATVPEFRQRLQGIIAIALTADEAYVSEPASVPAAANVKPLQTYGALRGLGSLKVAIIQSTRDDILSAAEARRRLGPDTMARRLRPIDASDHSFGGKLDELTAEMKASLDWMMPPSLRASQAPKLPGS